MPDPLTPQQLDDLVTIFSRYVTLGNLRRLGSLALGRDIAVEAANEVADPDAFVRRIVDLLSKADKLWELIARISEQAHKNSDLAVNLSTVLSGDSLLTEEQTQAFVQNTQLFFQSVKVNEVENALCAIGLGNGVNEIKGSGFLVGPDLVITNYHVVKNFLTFDEAANKVVENGPGDQIFCFFDYVSPPAPEVPPIEGRETSYVTVKAVPEKWLCCGRTDLRNDGTDGLQVLKNEYDYVVIKLEREIGKAPVRRSGGEPRGWLKMPAAINPLGGQQLMLVQHPAGLPRALAMGDFDSLDDSTTRVRYYVTTEKGSSGSPAITPQGLFAVHNATVKRAGSNGRKLNQGVRIDTIAADLAALGALGGGTAAPAAATAPLNRFWSLNDDLNVPQPIIGRSQFVNHVNAMMTGAPERVLVVSGPTGSGRHFSTRLLERYVGAVVPIAVYTPKELNELEPVTFLEDLMNQLRVFRATAVPIPEPNPAEGVPQWLGVDLPRWLIDRLAADEKRQPARYPAWIVIDLIVPDGKPLRWAKNLRDFLVGLVGVSDAVHQPIDIPQLRWLVLGATADPLALVGVKRREEDLTTWTTGAEDFGECLNLAWRSIGSKENKFSHEGLLAIMEVAQAEGVAKNLTPRQALADYVARLIARDPVRKR